MSNSPRCDKCMFWRDIAVNSMGECRRYTPFFRAADKDTLGVNGTVRVWPETENNDWCGEFAPKEQGWRR